MGNKYLPIGTVCTIKGNTNKIMIIGFLSINYNGNLNVYDYKGCIYPKGLFDTDGIISFNHNDIESVEFTGYQTDLHKNLNNNLENVSVVDTFKNQTKNTNKSKYVFDKNGVIIMDNDYQEKIETPSKEVNNPFALKYNTKKSNSVENKFKFDENGIIIEDNTSVISKNDKPAYEFDKNGFIIADNTVTDKLPKENNNKFKFDENGIIISDGTISKEETDENIEILNIDKKDNKMPYEFDKNGRIIADNTISNKLPKENNSKFKFDENGIIIAEG